MEYKTPHLPIEYAESTGLEPDPDYKYESLGSIYLRLLEKNPHDRPTIKELVKHPTI